MLFELASNVSFNPLMDENHLSNSYKFTSLKHYGCWREVFHPREDRLGIHEHNHIYVKRIDRWMNIVDLVLYQGKR
jgi:hypothetical protein